MFLWFLQKENENPSDSSHESKLADKKYTYTKYCNTTAGEQCVHTCKHNTMQSNTFCCKMKAANATQTLSLFCSSPAFYHALARLPSLRKKIQHCTVKHSIMLANLSSSAQQPPQPTQPTNNIKEKLIDAPRLNTKRLWLRNGNKETLIVFLFYSPLHPVSKTLFTKIVLFCALEVLCTQNHFAYLPKRFPQSTVNFPCPILKVITRPFRMMGMLLCADDRDKGDDRNQKFV